MAVWNLSILLFVKTVTHAGLSENLKHKQELILFHVPSYVALAFLKESHKPAGFTQNYIKV